MQSNNLSQDLIDGGLRAVNSVKQVSEFNPSFGGPIVEDRLWMYIGYRHLVSTQYNTGSFHSKDYRADQYCRTEGGCLYTDGAGNTRLVPDSRDLSKPGSSGDRYFHTATANFTGQLTERNKMTAFYQFGKRHKVSDSGIFRTPEATDYLTSDPDYIAQLKWTSPVTSRLLLEGGATFYNETWRFLQQPEFPLTAGQISKRELSTGTQYGADNQFWDAYNHQYNVRFALNYVTGTHSLKIGLQDMWGTRNYTSIRNQDQDWQFLNGAPLAINQYASPLEDLQKLRAALGIFVQDRWTIDNLTLNLGIRYDFHEAYVPAQTTPELQFVRSISYDAVEDTPSWRDISPRAGGRVGPARHREDGVARELRPLHRQRVGCDGDGQQPGQHAHQQRKAQLGRHQRRLHARLRPEERRGERRVRGAQPAARRPGHRHALEPGDCPRLRGPPERHRDPDRVAAGADAAHQPRCPVDAPLVRQLLRDPEPGHAPPKRSTATASRRRPTSGSRAAAATRSAASWT